MRQWRALSGAIIIHYTKSLWLFQTALAVHPSTEVWAALMPHSLRYDDERLPQSTGFRFGANAVPTRRWLTNITWTPQWKLHATVLEATIQRCLPEYATFVPGTTTVI